MGILQRQAIDKSQQQCQTHMHQVTSLVTYEERRQKVRRITDRPAKMEVSKTLNYESCRGKFELNKSLLLYPSNGPMIERWSLTV
jgi:hypothetical protein